jgi:pilus assembly protein CpaE
MIRAKKEERDLLKILLLGEDEAQRMEVRGALEKLADLEVELSEADPRTIKREASENVDVAMVVFGDNSEAPVAWLQSQHNVANRPMLVAVLRDRSSQVMRTALRAGADEVLFVPLEEVDLARALLKISESRRRTDQAAAGAVICSVTSVSGGVGVTSLAGNLALALRYSLQKKVAVVDLDLQSSDLAVLLNLEPQHSVLDVANNGKKLDSIQLESSLTKHASGVYLLAAPKRIEDSEKVHTADVSTALDVMRQIFDFIVIDHGRHINETSVMAWERSDHLLYVIDQSVSAARCAWRFLDLYGRLGIASVQPHFVLNRFLARHPITEKQITDTLARPIYARVPRDDTAFEQSLAKAQDIWQVAPRSALRKSFDELAVKISGTSAEAVGERPAKLMSFIMSIANAYA